MADEDKNLSPITQKTEELKKQNAEDAKVSQEIAEKGNELQQESVGLQKESVDATKDAATSSEESSKNTEKMVEKVEEGLEIQKDNAETLKQSAESEKDNKSAKKEKTQTNKAQQDRLVKGLKNIGSGIKGLLKKASDFAGETPTAIKALLTGGAFFLLAKFLQSDFAQNLVFKIYMRLKKLGKDIMEFDFSFMGLYNIIKDNFLTIVGILAVFKPKLLFNIIRASLFGLAKVIDSFGKETTKATKQSGMGKVFGKLKGSFASLKKGVAKFGSRIKQEAHLGLYKKGTLDKIIKDKFRNAGSSIKGSIKGMSSSLVKGFKAIGTLGRKGAALFTKKGLLAAGKYLLSLGRMLILPFKTLFFALAANPIALGIAIIVGIFIYIGKKLGIFKKLGKFLSSLFDKIVNGFRSLYNYFANSFVGKSLGLTPITDEATGDPKKGKDTVKESGETGTEFEGDEDSSSDIEPELTPEQKKQAAFDITSNALDKMVSMMGTNKGQNQQININNSKNNNSKSVTTANVAIDDNSPVIQSLKGQATA